MNRSSIWLPIIALIGMACLGLGVYFLFRSPTPAQIPQQSQAQPSFQSSSQPSSRMLEVPATKKWFDTGIDVTDKRVTVKYIGGQWTNEVGKHTPSVYSDCMGNGSWPGTLVANAPFRALVGKTDSAAFFVGCDYEVSGQRGRLYLSINDTDSFNDNAGILTVQITV